VVAVDLFSGFGGLSRGIETAGFTTIMAANHKVYKVEVHEANHPHAEHWIADLVDPDSSDYHSARDLPAADLLAAGVSCVNHSQANTQKAYEQGLSLFDLYDPDFDARVTRSERDRATANCVLHYAAQHHPRLVLVECTTELTSWGPAIPGRRKVGDGSTYRWWLRQFINLGYRYRVLYLNSQFFGVPQSRDRLYIAFWNRRLATPDLEHRPIAWCGRCDQTIEAVWTWRTGVPPTGSVRYGKQYDYRCPSCRRPVIPPMTPSLAALDLTNLGTRIGDKPIKTFKDGSTGPLAAATMARAERCRRKFAEFPAVLMPAQAVHGSERHPWQPMATQIGRQEAAILPTGAPIATGSVIAAHRHNGDGQYITPPMGTVTSTHDRAVLLAVDNYQGAPRGVDEPLPTQGASETLGVVSAGVLPFRKNTVPTTHAESMPTVTAGQIPGLLSAAGNVLFSGWFKQNGTAADATAPHPLTDPLGTLTARDTTAFLTAEWHAALADLSLQDCYFRMLAAHEIGRGCGFDVDFRDHKGDFIVWGSAQDQVDGFGNAVSPPVGAWIGSRLRAVLDVPEAIA
jgi:site-specific DNA-cytosine methylase